MLNAPRCRFFAMQRKRIGAGVVAVYLRRKNQTAEAVCGSPQLWTIDRTVEPCCRQKIAQGACNELEGPDNRLW
ncbi:MAG: hypothetical protein CSA20_06265 [Deltaproteobacteria bacterium]|nr:MAG: hypothetical protein CSA20_06265 [Deltaproteobacteria bacterium]